jgi:acyl-CoA thioester hydrolase
MLLLPEDSKSVVEVRVRFNETDLMGIVHHASYLVYFEAARVEWLRRRGMNYASWASGGVHLPVVEAELKYMSPARFDDVLQIETAVTDLRRVSFRFVYRILLGDKCLATGSTKLACINDKHKIVPMSAAMAAALSAGENVAN